MSDWYCLLNDVQIGPVSRIDLEKLADNRTISSTTLVWSPGMDEWKTYGEINPGVAQRSTLVAASRVERDIKMAFAATACLGIAAGCWLLSELPKRAEIARKMAGQALADEFNTAKIGDTHVVDLGGGVKMMLCYCPAGRFTMGSPANEAGSVDYEIQVPVQISRGFWLAQTECTQAQWRAVMGTEPSSFKGDELPVESVSWEDAKAFMAKLNGKSVLPSGWKWSLPTEAQWEYACRAGTTTPYAGELDPMAWHSGNSGGTTHSVGTKAANAWSLYDMHGNVNEWCSDWYTAYRIGGADPVGAPSGSSSKGMVASIHNILWGQYPDGTSFGSWRVIRGGSWFLKGLGEECRSAWRTCDEPGVRAPHLGFRAALVPMERWSQAAGGRGKDG